MIKINKQGASLDRLGAAAMLVLSTVILAELLSVNELDRMLRLALSSLAVAIPCLACTVYSLESGLADGAEEVLMTWYLAIVAYSGLIASLIGIGAVFWHFDPMVGRIFVGASIVAIVAGSAYPGRLNES